MKGLPHLSLFSAAGLLLAAVSAVSAQSVSKRFTEYGYDEVGRVSAIETAVEEAAPTVTGIAPAIVRRGPPVAVAVTGTSLRGATVTASHPGLTISAVTAGATRVTLTLQAGDAVPLGEHCLRFTTALGAAEIAFTLYPRLPVLTVSPNPLTLAPGESRAVTVGLGHADVIDHGFTLLATPAGVAAVTPNSAQLPAGATAASAVTATGEAAGNAVLRVESEAFADLLVPVFVTPRYRPPPGGASFYSPLLGVQVGATTPPPVLVTRGPFAAALLGVTMPGTSPPGSVAFGPFASSVLGVSRGPVVRAIQPDRVVRGVGDTAVEVRGVGLDTLASATLSPAAGVAMSLDAVEADGSRAQLIVRAEASAALGARSLRLFAADGREIPFADPAGGQLRIVEPLPEIDSVTPILLVRGQQSTTLTVRGVRLAGATAVRFTPSAGLTAGGTPTVNAAGTELTINVATAADAPLGVRVLSVVTASGESDLAAVPANTVTVIAGLGPAVTPVAAPLLGVRMPGGDTGNEQALSLTSAPLQVSRGAVFTTLQPNAAAVGETVTLQIDGFGLDGVTQVLFEPSAGLTVGTPTVAADGRQVGVEVAVAETAARGPRRVRLLTPSGEVPPSVAQVAQFRVTERLPQIESLSPLLWVPGAAPATLTLRGRYLNDATGLRVQPGGGVSFSSVTPGADGTSLTATVSVAVGAALGERAVIVDTPTGSSSEIASAANTIRLVSGLGAPVNSLTAPLLGVRVGAAGGATQTLALVAPLLGVQVAQTLPPSPQSVLLPSAATGVVVGPAATSLSPRYLPTGRSVELRIEGVGLDAVATVAFAPAEGIVLDGPPVLGGDGALGLPLTVEAGAAQTARRVLLRTAAGAEVPFAQPDLAVVRVVGNEPRIDSISPIQVTPGQTLTLVIRGGNLFGVSAVTATPATGLTFSANPSGNADGSEVTVALTVAPTAPGGPRTIRVVASAGTTTDDASPANTLTVVTGQ